MTAKVRKTSVRDFVDMGPPGQSWNLKQERIIARFAPDVKVFAIGICE
jgi:hypothetical protein